MTKQNIVKMTKPQRNFSDSELYVQGLNEKKRVNKAARKQAALDVESQAAFENSFIGAEL